MRKTQVAPWLALVVATATPAAASAQAGELAGLRTYIEDAVADWGAPGLAVAVVKDGSTVFEAISISCGGGSGAFLGHPASMIAITGRNAHTILVRLMLVFSSVINFS